jgi:hypothetical protein
MSGWPRPVSEEVLTRQKRYQKQLRGDAVGAYRAVITPLVQTALSASCESKSDLEVKQSNKTGAARKKTD